MKEEIIENYFFYFDQILIFLSIIVFKRETRHSFKVLLNNSLKSAHGSVWTAGKTKSICKMLVPIPFGMTAKDFPHPNL